MILLFFVLPVIFVILSNMLYLNRIDKLTQTLTDKSSKIVTQLAEDTIAEASRAVAQQTAIYLQHHPEMKKSEFSVLFMFLFYL